MSRATRLWLLAYPPAIRREFGREMAATLAEAWRDHPSLAARMALVLNLVRDALASWRGPSAAGGHATPGEPPRRSSRLTGLGADLRSALRLFLRQPLFALGAVVTLALGIGATSAIFSLADATLLRPLPIAKPGDVVVTDTSWSHPSFRDLESADVGFSHTAAWSNQRFGFDRDGNSVEIQGAAISGDYFALAGIRPVSGRLLDASDDRNGAAPVAVLSERAWIRLTGRDPSILGAVVQINRSPVTVVGIAPKAFRGLTLRDTPEIFVALRAMPQIGTGLLGRASTLATRNVVWLNVAGRLREGVSTAQAASNVQALAQRVDPPPPGSRPSPLVLTPVDSAAFASGGPNDSRQFVYLLVGATVVTLLLACATVANLLLVRAERRRREMALRGALGAGRGRLMRLVFIESLAIGLAGSLGAIAVALATLRLVGAFELPGRVPIADLGLSLSPTLVGIAIALGLGTSVLFGVVPAWHGSRVDAQAALREGARGVSRQPVRAVLVGAQVALCVLLLLGGLAFGRAVMHALTLDLGFDTTHTALLTLSGGRARYTSDRLLDLEHRITDDLSSQGWVASVGWMSILPLRGGMTWGVGVPVSGTLRPVDAECNIVSPGFFDAMGIPVRQGRAFTAADGSNQVVMINEVFARTYWPTGDPLNTSLAMDGDGKDPKMRATIVGVVGDTRRSIDALAPPTMYLLNSQHLAEMGVTQTLVARLRQSPATGSLQIAGIVKQIEPGFPLGTPQTMADHLGSLLMPQRLGLTLFLLFAGLAVVLTTFGIYAVVAFAVSQRTREIGIRMALGAEKSRVLGLVVSQGLRPVLTGAVIGAVGFALAGSALKSLIFALPTATVWSVVLVAAAVGVLSLGAMLVPARRALRIAPTEALRAD
jgi:predicted permease